MENQQVCICTTQFQNNITIVWGVSTVVCTKELKRVPLKYMAFSTHSLEITSLVNS